MASGDNHLSHWGGSATGSAQCNARHDELHRLYIGIKETGLKAFLAHFNPLGWGDPKMLLIGIPLYVLEWIGLLIKCVVLAMRLRCHDEWALGRAAFVGLVFVAREASHSLAYGVGLSVIIDRIVLTLLEVFICCLQAFVFTFLTVLFISMVATHLEMTTDTTNMILTVTKTTWIWIRSWIQVGSSMIPS